MSNVDLWGAGCAEASGGWPIDATYPTGKLVFGNGYTLPNRAVKHVDQGFFELLVSTYTGSNVETVNAFVPMAKREKNRIARIALALNFWWDASGNPYTDPMEGWVQNWADLTNATAATVSGVTGLQTLLYTPYAGADVVSIAAQVAPPTLGEATQGKGVLCGLVIEVPDVAAHITVL